MGVMIMELYYVPLQENRMNFSLSRHPTFEKYIVKDGVGVLVCYDNESDFNEDAIRTNNYGVHDTWTIIEGKNVKDVIKSFYAFFEGAHIGGSHIDSKALRIDRGRRIVKIPYCSLMGRSKIDQRFTCGPDGIFGGCVLGGITDFPDGECAMKRFCHIGAFNFSKRLPKGYVPKKIIVDNVVYYIAEMGASA